MAKRTGITPAEQQMRTTMRSPAKIEPGTMIEHLSTEWIVLSCSKALPSLHYAGYIVGLIEVPAWMEA